MGSSNSTLLNRNGPNCTLTARKLNKLASYHRSTVQRGPERIKAQRREHAERKGHSQAISGCGWHFSELLEEEQIFLNPRIAQTME